MENMAQARLSGRAAQAARNDERILEAARAVFLADPDAPITAVANEAGVGISALYGRYAGKEDLLRKLCRDGLERILEETERAVQDDREPWTAFSDFMRRLVDADLSALTLSLAGRFKPTGDMFVLAAETDKQLAKKLLPRIEGELRPGFGVRDIALILEMVGTIKVDDAARTRQLRRRYLTALLDGLRAEHTDPLPGSPPTRKEINERWQA
jgi:AcrR family transcriptional regulator